MDTPVIDRFDVLESRGHPGFKYRPDIDGLRAISIISVVFFHAYQHFLGGGYVGVDVFFVISGYLITGIIFREIRAGSFNVLRFYTRRVLRIFPALGLMLAACLTAGWFILQALDYQRLGEHCVANVLFVSNIVALLESGYFAPAAASNLLLHLWSLGVEEQFYLFWPGLLVLFLRSRSPMVLLGACFVASLALAILTADNTAYFYSPLNRFWELLGGGALALHEGRRAAMGEAKFAGLSRRQADAASFAGICLIAMAVFGLHPNDPYPGWRALMPVGGAVLLIAAGPYGFVNRTILSARPMVWIGLISYPLYLWHWPLLSLAYLQDGVWPGVGLASLLMVGAVGLSVLTYRFVELPLRHVARTRRPKAALALVGALVVIGCAGGGLDLDRGVPKRFPPSVSALEAIGNPYLYFDLWHEIRTNVCENIPAEQLIAQSPNPCVEAMRPLVLIWGDSYAATLYPGLLALQPKLHFGIAQFTTGNAPPFFEDDKRGATGVTLDVVNGQVLTAIRTLQPNVIIIAYMIDGINGAASPASAFSQVMVSIGKAQALSPHTKFVVIGPYPEWHKTLTADLIDVMLSPDHPKTFPLYMKAGLATPPFVFDDYFRTAFAKTNIIYISSVQRMCNSQGCLTRTGPELSDLTAVDFAHLTTAGSIYLVSKIAGEVPVLDGKGG